MSRTSKGLVAIVATLWGGAWGCSFDASGLGGDDSDSIGDDGTASTGGSTSGASASGASTTSEPAEGSGDTGSSCAPGTIGCPCDDGVCHAGLVCSDDECTSSTCGDGVLQDGEDCDPEGGPVDDDGCEDDCSFSRGARSIALGSEHTCAVTHFGRLRCWGDADRGKLGLGDEEDLGDEPDEVATADDVDAGAAVVRVALGTGFSCALRVGGEVVCWGYRANGRLGDGLDDSMQDIGDERGETAGTLGKVSIPGTVVDLAVGGSHACALRDEGQIYCWGTGMGGRLGYGNADDVGVTNTPSTVGPVTLPRQFAPRQVVAGAGHTCALSGDGDVLCWGDAATGILGSQTTEDIGDGEQPIDGVRVDLGGAPVAALSAGSQHTCALMENGALHCWGLGTRGRLGLGDEDDVGDDEAPGERTVALPALALAVSAGRAHTCALLEGGSVLCWGEGTAGQLGRGDTQHLGDDETLEGVEPIALDDDPAAVVQAVDTGGDHSCAVFEDGRVRCWGAASAGQLGYGNTETIGDDEVPADAGDVDFGA